MENQLYFIWSSIAMTIFYMFYQLVLKRETFFLWNRIYLLATLCLAMMLPLLNLSALFGLPQMVLMEIPLSFIAKDKLVSVSEIQIHLFSVLYWTGVSCSAIWLVIKLAVIKNQLHSQEIGRAFSFWRTKVIDPDLSDFDAINAHEEVHVKQLHTLDIIFVELIAVFFWFNPLIYCYRKSLKFVHEYLADEHAVKYAGSTKQYAMTLFLKSFKVGPVLTNTFYNPSLLEARIRMLQCKKSSVKHLWKYIGLVPMAALVVVLCSWKISNFSAMDSDSRVQPAIFPGGVDAFSSFLIQNSKKVSNERGKVAVSFIVEANGEVTHEKVENGLSPIVDSEALRIISLSPNWQPAVQNGLRVRSLYHMNINFNPDNQ
ncbi:MULTISPECIES: M56 family metallopeptidase [Sphingobacterium]|uniref:M56 family metallopeptidase n=1 Tax=Sphingobacterium TaxID=28453 RepID=UPI00104FBFB2|nr:MULTISPECIES: M56 family metallopeptidase [Sphingobacterium]MCW2259537.1 hypothetical protein [Sphingobacterium kitahiroshimense]TCR14017.1 TonB-like protein [Sphingobacterium sp. JUb78]